MAGFLQDEIALMRKQDCAYTNSKALFSSVAGQLLPTVEGFKKSEELATLSLSREGEQIDVTFAGRRYKIRFAPGATGKQAFFTSETLDLHGVGKLSEPMPISSIEVYRHPSTDDLMFRLGDSARHLATSQDYVHLFVALLRGTTFSA